MDTPTPHPSDLILENSRWVHALARSLVRDANAADDLVQRAWLATRAHPAQDVRSPRDWIARVVRNLALSDAREDVRRRRREEEAARAQADERDRSIDENLEVQQRLIEALRALDDPYRSALWARYHEGLTPRVIAARDGVPVKTVKTRISRGLELLRQRFDREHGGDRRAWIAALVPIVPRFAWTSAVLGVLLMSTKWKIASVVAALVCATFLALRITTTEQETAMVDGAPRADKAALALEPQPLAPPQSDARRDGLATEAAAERPGSTAISGKVEIAGRFLSDDGAAIDRVEVTAEVVQQDETGAVEQTIEAPRVASGLDGRFLTSLAPHPGWKLRMAARCQGFAPGAWEWEMPAGGRRIDLGDVVMPRSGGLRGRVLLPSGNPVGAGWKVDVSSPGAGDPFSTTSQASVDPRTGEYAFTALPIGAGRVAARHKLRLETPRRDFELEAGRTTEIDLLFDGPDPARRLLVGFRAPTRGCTAGVQEFALISADGTERVERFPSPLGGCILDGVEPGIHRLETRDPRVEQCRVESVRIGSELLVEIRGSASLRLEFPAGKVPNGFELDLGCLLPGRGRGPRGTPLVSKDEPLPADGRIRGVFPGTLELTARAEGRVPVTFTISDLGLGEERVVPIELSRGARVRGRVLRAGGTLPAQRVDLRLARVEEDVRHGEVRPDVWTPDAKFLRTDELGAFEFDGVGPGRFTLRARVSTAVHATIELDVPHEGEISSVALELPAVAKLHGRVLVPEGVRANELTLVVNPARALAVEGSKTGVAQRASTRVRASLADDGSFACPDTFAEAVVVTLELPKLRWKLGLDASSESSGPELELDRVTLTADTDVERVYDVRGTYPSSSTVQVSVNGMSVPGVVVLAHELSTLTVRGAAETGQQGLGTLTPLPDGEYELVAWAPDHAWCMRAPSRLVVRAGGAARVAFDVSLTEGRLEVLDADGGAPATSVKLRIELEGLGGESSVVVKLQPDGSAALRVPRARYVLRAKQGKGEGAVTFDWPTNGPVSLPLLR